MRSTLSPSDYLSAEVLANEQQRIFRRLWIVAGFKSTLLASDAFLTHEIGGIPILVQNTTKGLRAFINQCAHRQSPVQTADFGQRRMACPYHGWVYDGDGRLKNIPGQAANYGFTDETVCKLGLRAVHLREESGLVFVNLAEKPIAFETQFDQDFRAELAGIASKVGDDAIFARFDAGYNWKLNFENVVDWNHVPFVHAGSFAPMMPGLRPAATNTLPPAPPPDADDAIEDDLRLLSYVSRGPFDFSDWPWYDALERCGPTREYVNVFIYPNVNYVVMAGAIHLIQQFCPIAPDRTRVRLTMALGRRKARLPAAPAILWGHLKAEKRVINEDLVILEGLQRGLGEGSPPAFHGWYEHRLRRIAKSYRRLLTDA